MSENININSKRIDALADFSRRHIEVSLDVTSIRLLQGERRLLEWNN